MDSIHFPKFNADCYARYTFPYDSINFEHPCSLPVDNKMVQNRDRFVAMMDQYYETKVEYVKFHEIYTSNFNYNNESTLSEEEKVKLIDNIKYSFIRMRATAGLFQRVFIECFAKTEYSEAKQKIGLDCEKLNAGMEKEAKVIESIRKFWTGEDINVYSNNPVIIYR